MGKKYIIEMKEGERIYKTKLNALNEPVIREITCEPYAEPDLEQVRKEAYEDGYKTAKVQCNIQAEKDMREVGGRHYQRGLSDAWDAARKVVALSTVDRREVFGSEYMYSILEKHTAAEAIEKIRQYEQEKEEYHIGDEVIRHYKNEFMEGDDTPSIFLSEEDGYFRCLAFNGRSIMIAEYPKNQYRKTGRYFPEIAAVLKKMREE